MQEYIKIYSDEELNNRNDGLKKIKIGMEELNINFFLIMGILLGAVREKNFIKWDWDVELGFFTDKIINRVDEIIETFEKSSFKVEVVNESYEGFKINLFYYGNKFTLWGLHQKGDWLQRTAYKFPKKHFEKLDLLEFLGETYMIPNNVEELLTFIYGDWETPRKTLVKTDYLDANVFNKKSLFKRIINKIIH
jgi:lipopolysaccharide cholinephosphotransferase